MRKLITAIFFMLGITFAVNSQTLQFSQVKLVTSTEETVPPNKVWKVEGIGAARVIGITKAAENPSFAPQDQTIFINNTAVSVIQTVGTGSGAATAGCCSVYTSVSYAASATKLPLWLPEGTTLKTGSNVSFISVIEFTVVP